jgi:vacuolar-type H+-ATPase subunit I/STV1
MGKGTKKGKKNWKKSKKSKRAELPSMQRLVGSDNHSHPENSQSEDDKDSESLKASRLENIRKMVTIIFNGQPQIAEQRRKKLEGSFFQDRLEEYIEAYSRDRNQRDKNFVSYVTANIRKGQRCLGIDSHRE